MAGPLVDLALFPIVATAAPGNDPTHVARSRAICQAATRALSLPAGVALDASADYATLAYCMGADGRAEDEKSYRLRINGFMPGKGKKKDREYVSMSFVALDAANQVIGWSEDLRFVGDGAAEARAAAAGKPPPAPKTSPKDCALLSIVDATGTPTPITPAFRALVAALAPAAPAAKKKTASKPR